MPLEILPKQAIRLRRPVNVFSGRAKPLAEASGVRRRVLFMIDYQWAFSIVYKIVTAFSPWIMSNSSESGSED